MSAAHWRHALPSDEYVPATQATHVAPEGAFPGEQFGGGGGGVVLVGVGVGVGVGTLLGGCASADEATTRTPTHAKSNVRLFIVHSVAAARLRVTANARRSR